MSRHRNTAALFGVTRFILGIAVASSPAFANDKLAVAQFVRIQTADGLERIARADAADSSNAHEKLGPGFTAIVGDRCPAGLVPIFSVESDGRFELRRLPPRGQENDSEPLFFALPRVNEPHATNIAGVWSCSATNAQGYKHYPEWELAVDGEHVAGRFVPQSEYRVAFITGGTFRSNAFELRVEYNDDRYLLSGHWKSGALAGRWRQLDDSQRGTWHATREPAESFAMPAGEIIALIEWQHGKRRRYSVETQMSEPGWQRAAEPLCRVWRSK